MHSVAHEQAGMVAGLRASPEGERIAERQQVCQSLTFEELPMPLPGSTYWEIAPGHEMPRAQHSYILFLPIVTTRRRGNRGRLVHSGSNHDTNGLLTIQLLGIWSAGPGMMQSPVAIDLPC